MRVFVSVVGVVWYEIDCICPPFVVRCCSSWDSHSVWESLVGMVSSIGVPGVFVIVVVLSFVFLMVTVLGGFSVWSGADLRW